MPVFRRLFSVCLFTVVILGSGVFRGGAVLLAQQAGGLELQLNARFWQLLGREELSSLLELRRKDHSVQRIVPLEWLYPGFRSVESIDSRNLRGELLEVSAATLEDSYLELGRNGELTLFLAGQIQQDPQQLNIYGEVWPEATLRLWLEESLEQPFLLSELETYQRFHNLRLEVQIFRDIKQAFQHSIEALPDMILADRETTAALRNLFQKMTVAEESSSLASLELFASELFAAHGQYYSAPLALESYGLLYNSEMLGPNTAYELSELFAQLEKLGSGRPHFLGFGTDTLPLSLLLHSFLKTGLDDTPNLYTGLQYLREQARKGRLRQIDFAAERFARGEIAAIIARSGELQKIRDMSHVKVAELPFNDLSNNKVAQYLRIWNLSILRQSPAKAQAVGLRNYLLRGGLQGQFDLRQGLLPSNTIYYPFYQRSLYYWLLPDTSQWRAMGPKELWEYGIEQRNMYREVETLDRLLRDRLAVLLDSNISLDLVLADWQQQWQREVLPQPKWLFLNTGGSRE